MNEERAQFLPDADLQPFVNRLDSRITEIVSSLNVAEFRRQIVGEHLKNHLKAAFHAAGADEGTFWLADHRKSELVPVFNNGPQSQHMLNEVRQPISAGIIGMVFSTEQAFCENDVYKNTYHDKTIDETMMMTTCAMIASPLYFTQHTRGVISCVRLKSGNTNEPDPREFSFKEFRHVQLAAETLQIIIEQRLQEVAIYGS